MTNVVSDVTSTVNHIFDYPIFPSSHITVASLIALVLLFGLGAFWICAYRAYLRRGMPSTEPSPLGLDLV